MNDPGLDEALANEAHALDRQSNFDTSRRFSSVAREHRLDAQRPLDMQWWLASSAYPLAAVCLDT